MSLLAFLLAAAAVPSFQLPIPEQYQGKAVAVVLFVEPEDLPKHCGKPEKGLIRLGCADVGGPQMTLPNPCHFKEEFYAKLVCHEKAHINGWSHD